MRKQTWMKNAKTIVVTLVLISATGCMSAGGGSPHPFASMFQNYYPPAQKTQHVFKTSYSDCTADQAVTAIQ